MMVLQLQFIQNELDFFFKPRLRFFVIGLPLLLFIVIVVLTHYFDRLMRKVSTSLKTIFTKLLHRPVYYKFIAQS